MVDQIECLSEIYQNTTDNFPSLMAFNQESPIRVSADSVESLERKPL